MSLTLAIISLLFSAFFSGIEIAFVSSNKLKLELDKRTGKFPSNIIAFFSKNPSDFITTMLVGNNIALVIYGIVMTDNITPVIEQYFTSAFSVLMIQTLITTVIILITAEFLPKVIFRLYPNQILRLFSVPIAVFYIVLRPVTIFMMYISKFIIRYIFNQKISENKSVFDRVDLDDYLKNLKSDDNKLDSRVEVEMLKNALDLSMKKVRECMIPRTEIVAVKLDASIEELKKEFIRTKLSKILVFKDNIDDIVGYVHSSDLFKKPKTIKSCLLEIPIVPESMLAMEMLNLFLNKNKGISLVVDEFGGTSGIITIEDITEEIVGEIEDEHDKNSIKSFKIADNEYIIEARLDVVTVNKKYSLDLPESEEYETIAGLVLHSFEEIPKEGEVLHLEKYVITIKSVDDRSIRSVHLTKAI